ncbi:hypothetical protein BGZ79_006192, partial [Entomortierella chlamydospora]
LLNMDQDETQAGQYTLTLLNTMRVLSAHDAARISQFRKGIYLDQLEIKHGNTKEKSLLTLEDVATAKAATELVRKTYKKPSKDKPKKPDYKSNKDKSSTSDKTMDKQASKTTSKDKTGYKSDNGGSGSKSDNGKSSNKFRSKSGSGTSNKKADQGNDNEKSD